MTNNERRKDDERVERGEICAYNKDRSRRHGEPWWVMVRLDRSHLPHIFVNVDECVCGWFFFS